MNKIDVCLTLFDYLLEKQMFVGHCSPNKDKVFVTLWAYVQQG